MRVIPVFVLLFFATFSRAEPIVVNAEPITLEISEEIEEPDDFLIGRWFQTPIYIQLQNGVFLPNFELRAGDAIPQSSWDLVLSALPRENQIRVVAQNRNCLDPFCEQGPDFEHIRAGTLVTIPAHGLRFAELEGGQAELEIRVTHSSAMLFADNPEFFNDVIEPQRYSVPVTTIDEPTTPETGWWWNPGEPGRGLFIERREDRLFAAVYAYDANGRPTWYTTQGLVDSDQRFASELLLFENGQTLTGSHQTPSAVGSFGPVTIEFTSATTAVVGWPGDTTPMERFNFVPEDEQPLDPLTDLRQPIDGWYWDPTQPGTGFSLEVQRNQVFLAGYLYDADGASAWYTAQGSIVGASFDAPLLEFRNGQAIGASFRRPVVARDDRRVRFSFDESETLTLVLDGQRTIILERFSF